MIDKITDNLRSPIALAVAVSVAVIAFILAVPSAIGVSYLVTANQIHHNTVAIEQVQKQAAQRAIQQEIRSSMGTCTALVTLDHASAGIKFPAPGKSHPSELALTRLFAGIHDVVSASHCKDLLDGNYHIKDGQIVPGPANNTSVPVDHH